MMMERRITRAYCVGGHLFGVTAGEEDVRLMDNYEPFSATEAARVYGSPWSGKTPCYRNVGYPLGGIVQLSQAPRNEIGRLSGIRAYAAIMQSVSGKRWERRIADGLHSTQSCLAASVAVWHLQCLPDREAAEICESAVTEKA